MIILFTLEVALDIIMGRMPCPREVVYHPIRKIGNKVRYSQFFINGQEIRPYDHVRTDDPAWKDYRE